MDNSGNLWKGKSDSAWVNKDGTVMKLDGDVDMHRIESDKAGPVKMLTRDLTITTDPKDRENPQQPRERRMETAAETTVIDPDTVARGVGMKADLTLKSVEFLADFHSTTQPEKLR